VAERPDPDRPLVVFDGECGLCRASARLLARRTGERIAYESYQTAAERYAAIPPERCRESVQLLEPGGRVTQGAQAIARALWLAGRWTWLLAVYRRVPGAAPLAEWGYRLVARHRRRRGPAPRVSS
jgi:lipase maturation factor 1